MMTSDVCLSVWRPSVAYIVPKSRTERPRKTKIGTEVAHVTRDSDTTFKVKWSKVKVTVPLYSPLRLHIRQLQRSPLERIHRGNLRLRCRLQAQAARGASASTEGGEGRGHIVAAARLQLVYTHTHILYIALLWVLGRRSEAAVAKGTKAPLHES